ncbi:MAG: hypothetical protein U1F43_28380 [Myxococcota bacterium]
MRIVYALCLSLCTATAAQAADPVPPPYGLPALERSDFNRLAAVAGLPLFWRNDTETPGQIDPAELAMLGDGQLSRFVAKPKKAKSGEFLAPSFTKDFEKAYRQLVELRRREAVAKELEQGRPTLVETDLSAASDEDKAIVKSLSKAAKQIDELYEVQIGAAGLAAKVPKDDFASKALLARNHGPTCEAALTQNDKFCNAISTFPTLQNFSWPQGAEVDSAYCAKMAAEPNGKDLTSPFTVVRPGKKSGFDAVPYTKAYARQMKGIAATLKATAKLVKSKEEQPFKDYLLAAASAFETNDWPAADEAWAAMSADNSRWYLRIGPDETYWEPCQVKAGFHMSFALIDRTALEWKQKLTAVRSDMEATLASLIGAPYVKREVNFKLPEFINIVLNAGDSRDGIGATVGQSLPNFGKVAEESRGRTVAMVNLYTDADSLGDLAKRDRSLFSDASFAYASEDPSVERLGTVLHEATHNLGPYGSWKVDGKAGEEVFGGPTDAILEELKAQTGALYFISFLKSKGLVEDKDVRENYLASISWAFGHIARGMTTGDGKPKTYSQLAAIQVGELMSAGAIRWVDGGATDPGRFDFDFDKMPAAVENLMKTVGHIKAAGDAKAAADLIARNVSPEGLAKIHADVITARVLRYPKASFVYGVTE